MRAFSRVVASAVLASAACAYSPMASSSDTLYTADIALYRLSNVLVSVSGYDKESANNPAIERKLDSPWTFESKNVHITKIFQFISEVYEIRFSVDDNLIEPAGSVLARSKAASNTSKDHQGPDQATASLEPPPGTQHYVTSGMVEYIKLKNVPLRQGLDMLLHPLDLGFTIEGDHVRIRKRTDVTSGVDLHTLSSGYLNTVPHAVLRIGNERVALGSPPTDAPWEALARIPGVQLLSRSKVVLKDGQMAEIHAEDESGRDWIQLLPPEASKQYQLRQTDEKPGTVLRVKFASQDENILRGEVGITTRYIESREPVPGTSLAAGKPVFRETNGSASFSTSPNSRTAFLMGADHASNILQLLPGASFETGTSARFQSGAGGVDEGILLIATVTRTATPDAVATPELPQYSIETKYIQVRGEPDWEWWTRPFATAYRLYEGAGRALGPVDASGYSLSNEKDWRTLGFSSVKDPELLSAPRITNHLNSRARIKDGTIPTLYKMVVPSFGGAGGGIDSTGRLTSFGNDLPQMYNDLAITPKALRKDDLMGVSIIADVKQPEGESRNGSASVAGKYTGYMALIETDSTETLGLYRLDHNILVNEDPASKSKQGRKSGLHPVHAQIHCDYRVQDGASTAFLVPLAKDEYLVVLSTFSLLKENGARHFPAPDKPTQ